VLPAGGGTAPAGGGFHAGGFGGAGFAMAPHIGQPPEGFAYAGAGAPSGWPGQAQ
jgi:hypothetical protein